jgi:hypothetical protein
MRRSPPLLLIFLLQPTWVCALAAPDAEFPWVEAARVFLSTPEDRRAIAGYHAWQYELTIPRVETYQGVRVDLE